MKWADVVKVAVSPAFFQHMRDATDIWIRKKNHHTKFSNKCEDVRHLVGLMLLHECDCIEWFLSRKSEIFSPVDIHNKSMVMICETMQRLINWTRNSHNSMNMFTKMEFLFIQNKKPRGDIFCLNINNINALLICVKHFKLRVEWTWYIELCRMSGKRCR